MQLARYQKFAICGSLLAVGQCVLADSMLGISAETPEIQVQPRTADSGYVHLPDLTYVFNVDAQCSQELQPLSLLISVADTRKTLTAEAIGADPAITVMLEIPANQIAPVAVRDFCLSFASPNAESGLEVTGPGSRKLPAVLSAQASMRCGAMEEVSESEEQTPQDETVYASTPLDVMLTCEISAPSTEPSIR